MTLLIPRPCKKTMLGASAGPASCTYNAIIFSLFKLRIVAAIHWWKHLGDFVHDRLGRLIDVLTGDLCPFGFEDDGFTIGDGDIRAELFERTFTPLNGDRHHGNARTEGNHAKTGVAFGERAGPAAGPLWEDK